MRRRRIVVAAASGTLGLGLAAPLAAHADTVPPTGSASGTGASLSAGGQPVLAVSPSSASAGADGTSASAYTVQVAGTNVTPGGSSQNGSQPAGGSGPSTPAGSPVEAAVTPYSASSSSGTADAHSALAHAAVGGSSGVNADVVRSDSSATYNSSRSTGRSSTDGAVVNAGGPGGLTVDLLHSQTDSTSGAGAYVASINGHEIGSSQDVGQICSSLSNSLLRLACVVASGGEAFVGNAAVPGGPSGGSGGSGLSFLLLDAFGAGAGTGTASPAVATSAVGTATPADTSAATPPGAAGSTSTTATTLGLPVVQAGPAMEVPPASGNGGHLPFTGAPIEFYVLVSGALLALGGVVWKLSTVVRPVLVG